MGVLTSVSVSLVASLAAGVPLWCEAIPILSSIAVMPKLPFDPVREAGARTDNALFRQARSSPPSVALRRRVAARSPMSSAASPLHISSSRR